MSVLTLQVFSQSMPDQARLQTHTHAPGITGITSVIECPAKIILQGTVNGGRRQGRQKKGLEDNIRDWTGLEFGRS